MIGGRLNRRRAEVECESDSVAGHRMLCWLQHHVITTSHHGLLIVQTIFLHCGQTVHSKRATPVPGAMMKSS